MRKPITNQELFDKVVAHAQSMRKCAFHEEMQSCAYRTPDGNRCFVGGLITDEVYASYNFNADDDVHFQLADGPIFGHNTLEGKTATNPLVREAIERSLGIVLDEYQIMMLSELQQIHDASFSNRETGLRTYATRKRLIYKGK